MASSFENTEAGTYRANPKSHPNPNPDPKPERNPDPDALPSLIVTPNFPLTLTLP